MESLGICRICLNKDVQHVVKSPQLQDIYEKLTTIPADERPLALCYICFAQLKTSHRFMLKCLKAEELLAQMLSNEDGVLDPTRIDRSALDQMSFSSLEHTIITDSALQDVDEGEVLNIYERDVKLEGHNSQDRPELIDSTDSEPDIEQTPSDPGDDIPLCTIKKELETVMELEEEEAEDVEVEEALNCKRKSHRNALKRAIPIAKKSKLKPEGNRTQDVKIVNIDPVTVKPEASKSKRYVDVKNPLKNNISSNRKYSFETHNKDQQKEIVKNNLAKNVDVEIDCVKRDRKKIDTIKHAHINTDAGKPYMCDLCNRCFTKKDNLKTHIRIHHTYDKRHACNYCKKRFTFKSQLVYHTRKHTGEKPFVCHVCEKSFTEKGALKSHARTHTGAKAYVCKVCEKVFTTKESLAKHASIHVGEKASVCHVCGKTFKLKGNLIKHVRIHTGERPFACNVCKKAFTVRSSLKIHARVHTGEKPFVCNVCGKNFGQNYTLLKHSRIHTGEKPYVCNVCGKGFTVKDRLNLHSRTHTGEKPYVCNVCNKGFSIKGNLRVHLRLHSGKNTHF